MLLGFERDTNKQSTQIMLILVTLFSLFMLYRFLRKTESFAKWLAVLAVSRSLWRSPTFCFNGKIKRQ